MFGRSEQLGKSRGSQNAGIIDHSHSIRVAPTMSSPEKETEEDGGATAASGGVTSSGVRGDRAPGDSGLRAVRLPSTGIIVPERCAGCCAPAGLSLREERTQDSATAIVPYCTSCHRQAASATTRLMSVVAASALLALTTALTLPLLFAGIDRVSHAALAVAAASIPVGLAFWRGRHRFGGLPRPWLDKAAWWGADGSFVCVCAPWAQSLAALNGSLSEPCTSERGRQASWLFVGPLLGLLAAPLAFGLFNAHVRLLNLTDSPISVAVVGGPVTVVQPSSSESPSAGAQARWPTGARKVRVLSELGTLLGEDTVFVRPGQEHLFAPGSRGTCFWIESEGYGKSGPSTRLVAPLASKAQFWVLPRVDTWFAPNPAKPQDDRSTGGMLSALRQAPCDEAPSLARAPTGSVAAE